MSRLGQTVFWNKTPLNWLGLITLYTTEVNPLWRVLMWVLHYFCTLELFSLYDSFSFLSDFYLVPFLSFFLSFF